MMKKNTLYTALALAAAALLTGCSNESGIPAATTAALQLQVGIGAIETRVAALSGTTFARESKINVVLTDYTDPAIGDTPHYNTSGIYIYKDPGTGGVWLPLNAAAPLQLTPDGARVLAHYPAELPSGAEYNVSSKVFTPVVPPTLAIGDLMAGDPATGGYNADNSFWFTFKNGEQPTEVFMAEGEIDYMYGNMTNAEAVTSAKKLAQIEMNHALTMVVFNLFKSDQNLAPCIVKSITVKNADPATTTPALCKGTFAIPGGAFTPTQAETYMRTLNNFPDNSYFGMMMFPATIDSDEVVVEFKVDDHTYTLPIDPIEWKAGQVNLYRVRFTPVSAELVDVVRVADWGTTKEVEFEIN